MSGDVPGKNEFLLQTGLSSLKHTTPRLKWTAVLALTFSTYFPSGRALIGLTALECRYLYGRQCKFSCVFTWALDAYATMWHLSRVSLPQFSLAG